MIVFDTIALIDLFRGPDLIREFIGEDVATTMISHYEVLAGGNHRKAKKGRTVMWKFWTSTRWSLVFLIYQIFHIKYI